MQNRKMQVAMCVISGIILALVLYASITNIVEVFTPRYTKVYTRVSKSLAERIIKDCKESEIYYCLNSDDSYYYTSTTLKNTSKGETVFNLSSQLIMGRTEIPYIDYDELTFTETTVSAPDLSGMHKDTVFMIYDVFSEEQGEFKGYALIAKMSDEAYLPQVEEENAEIEESQDESE